ncbi:MAG: hypothetical protein R6V85_14850 [Polyangia bacterium]
MRSVSIIAAAISCCLLATALWSAAADSRRPAPGRENSRGAREVLRRLDADPDPAAVRVAARALTPRDLLTAVYRGDRSQRLVAVSAAGYLDDPLPMIPYLVALSGARQRETASRAAHALLLSLDRLESGPEAAPELIGAQARQIAGQSLDLAKDERLDVDIRVVGVETARRVSALGGVEPELEGLLADGCPALRGAALAAWTPPLSKSALAAAAEMVERDESPMLRGQAAGLLCENALAHGVKAPSPDLIRLLRGAIADRTTPAEGVAPIMACLARFSPRARSELVEGMRDRDDEALADLWEELTAAE